MFKKLFAIIGIAYVGIWCLLFGLRFLEKRVLVNEGSRVCLVTGASSGIGAALSKRMVRRGWTVIGVARRAPLLEALSVELGKDRFIPYVGDVGDLEAVHAISTQIKIRGLKPTLFFLNAGMGGQDLPYQISTKQHKATFDVNYLGVIAWVEEWIAAVKGYGGGVFVATSSVSALYPPPGVASYSASKAALNASFRAWGMQYLHENIGFVVALPGPVATDMLKTKQPLPFTQRPEGTAQYIIEQTFSGERFIEPAWFYKAAFALFRVLPDSLVLKILMPMATAKP